MLPQLSKKPLIVVLNGFVWRSIIHLVGLQNFPKKLAFLTPYSY